MGKRRAVYEVVQQIVASTRLIDVPLHSRTSTRPTFSVVKHRQMKFSTFHYSAARKPPLALRLKRWDVPRCRICWEFSANLSRSSAFKEPLSMQIHRAPRLLRRSSRILSRARASRLPRANCRSQFARNLRERKIECTRAMRLLKRRYPVVAGSGMRHLVLSSLSNRALQL